MYPNPAEDVLNIRLSDLTGLKTVQIFNAQGKVVETFTSIKNELNINVEAFKPGLYTVKIDVSNQTVIRKISIK